MEKRQPRNVFLIVGSVVLALWACSVLVRMVWFTQSATSAVTDAFWTALGLLVFASVAWGLVRKIRTGELTTRNVERAFTKEPGGPLWPLFSTIVTGVGAAIIGGAIASVIAVTELNNSFSREAVDRATGEYPILFWGILGAGFILGTGGYIWSIAVSGQTKPSEPEKGESEKGPS